MASLYHEYPQENTPRPSGKPNCSAVKHWKHPIMLHLIYQKPTFFQWYPVDSLARILAISLYAKKINDCHGNITLFNPMFYHFMPMESISSDHWWSILTPRSKVWTSAKNCCTARQTAANLIAGCYSRHPEPPPWYLRSTQQGIHRSTWLWVKTLYP